MDKYSEWVNVGFKRLVEDFCREGFKPQNESDIKCHLYSTLLQTKSQVSGLTPNHLVLSEFPGPTRQEAVDLALVRWRKRKDVFHPRLLVEIKETSLTHLTADEVEDRIRGDIEKLRRYRRMLEEEGKTEVLKYFKTPVVAFFFRGASEHGIGVKTNYQMKKLQERYEDIGLLWGPAE